MTPRGQIVLSVAIVALAASLVGAYTLLSAPSPGPVGADPHATHGVAGASGDPATPVRLTAETARRIGVTYATATRRTLTREVRALGNVGVDERRIASVDPRVEGWVERLHVDFTGAPVREGEPLLDLYSPALVAAQEELILARRLAGDAAASGSERGRVNAAELLDAARRRLRYWAVPEAAIARIERTGAPERTLALLSPATGVVVEKAVTRGSRVMPGMELFRIADLRRVWVEVDVFEKDLSLVRLGQHGVISFEAYPERELEGLVTYVHSSVAPDTRTGRVRLELDNPDLALKPGMYASVLLHLRAPREGIVVPRTAVLQTGERSLVFVHGPDGSIAARPVRPGLASGDDLEILAGLAEGEVVVASASFLIDAESNLGASVASLDEPAGPPAGHAGH